MEWGRTAMSTQELKRAGILARVEAGTLKLGSAAALMAVSSRQAKRLYRRYRAEGAKGLQHRGADRPSNRATAPKRRERILELVREKYSGGVEERFGPTLAPEHLASEDREVVDHETLRRWMLAAGLWSRARKRSPHRRRRVREAHFGELVQLDGRFHRWFEDRGPESCLMTMVDDATGRSLGRFSVDWRAGELTVRGKGLIDDRLPLPPDVGAAIAAYVRKDRPACPTRRVFVCMKAPHRGFHHPSTVSTIVRRALERADLAPSIKGAHLLRHLRSP